MRYLINCTTKEHKAFNEKGTIPKPYADWVLIQADSEGWIAHTGNECPLPDDAKCEYKMRDGDNGLVFVGAGELRWSHDGINRESDIVAYRPIFTEKVQESEPIPEPQYDPRSVSFNLLDRLKAAHAQAQTIPDLEAELREILAGMGYDLVLRSPFTQRRHGAGE